MIPLESSRGLRILLITAIWLALIPGACGQRPGPAPVEAPSKPAAFILSDLRLPDLAESVYERAEVGVTITNVGDEEGTYTAVIKVDGSVAGTQNVTLAGGESRQVFFTVPVTSQLGQTVTIGNLTGKLDVQAN